MKRNFVLAAAIVAVAWTAAACGGSPHTSSVAHVGSGGSQASGASPGQLSPSDKEHVWLQYAGCLRQHGASEPDPGFDSLGNPQWQVNPKSLSQAATQACEPILQSANLQQGHAASPADIAAGTRFAQCMRQNGIPDFPDPNPNTGSLRPSPATGDLDPQSPQFQHAQQACIQSLGGVEKGG